MRANINLHNMDCMKAMLDMKDNQFDLTIVDPPYGIKRDKGGMGNDRKTSFGMSKRIAPSRVYDSKWDSIRPPKSFFDELIRISKKILVFGGNYFADYLPPSTHWIVWDKLQTMPSFSDCELIYTNIPRNSVKKYTLQWNGLLGKEKTRIHPTQKPIALYLNIEFGFGYE